MWLTLSCCWKLAKPVNSFLSFSGFFPLSRLTYCTYLIHPTVMMITSFQCEAPMHLKHGMVVRKFSCCNILETRLSFSNFFRHTVHCVSGQRSHLIFARLRTVHHVRGACHKIAEIVLPKIVKFLSDEMTKDLIKSTQVECLFKIN